MCAFYGSDRALFLTVRRSFGADVFVGDISFDQWDPTEFLGTEARAGGPWNFSPDELWSKEVALSKLAEMRETVGQLLARLDDAALLEPEAVHPWTGQTRMGKMIYELRHIQHHLGAVDPTKSGATFHRARGHQAHLLSQPAERQLERRAARRHSGG